MFVLTTAADPLKRNEKLSDIINNKYPTLWFNFIANACPRQQQTFDEYKEGPTYQMLLSWIQCLSFRK